MFFLNRCRRGEKDVYSERNLVHEELARVDRLQTVYRETGCRPVISQ